MERLGFESNSPIISTVDNFDATDVNAASAIIAELNEEVVKEDERSAV
jgi:hypothetical protein